MKKVVEKLENTPGYKPRPANQSVRKIPTNRPKISYRAEPNVLYPDLPPSIPPPDYEDVVQGHQVDVVPINTKRPKTERDEKQRMRTQLPIGISVRKNGTDGVMSIVMEAKTPLIPTPKKLRRYTTSIDNQQVVTIEVSFNISLIMKLILA